MAAPVEKAQEKESTPSVPAAGMHTVLSWPVEALRVSCLWQRVPKTFLADTSFV